MILAANQCKRLKATCNRNFVVWSLRSVGSTSWNEAFLLPVAVPHVFSRKPLLRARRPSGAVGYGMENCNRRWKFTKITDSFLCISESVFHLHKPALKLEINWVFSRSILDLLKGGNVGEKIP